MALNKHKLNQKHASEGVWFTYLGGDLKMRIAYCGPSNKKFQRLYQEGMRPHRRRSMDDMDGDEIADILGPVYAKAAVTDWSGARWSDDDPELDCTEENVVAVLKEVPGLLTQVIRDASNADAFKDWDAAKGNS